MTIDDSRNKPQSGIGEYISALLNARSYGSQVADHHRLPAKPASLRPVGPPLDRRSRERLKRLGFDTLYDHQMEALTNISEGRHTVVATPTASGKTLIYNASVFQAVDADSAARALYLFPLKALAQDQLNTFTRWAELSSMVPAPTAAIYDGDTNDYQRKKIRMHPPNVVITNPEMVHLALLPFHERWQTFFANLKLVIIDEVHTFRGMLGAHMAQVIRRLRRVCDHYGAIPTFVFASATVANPGELASRLSGLSVHTIEKSGAPHGGRHIVLIDPLNGPAQTAIDLLKAALARQLRSIVYTQSRKMAELIAAWAQERAGRWANRISVYRAGLMPEDRRVIEQRLKNGDLLAVVSTSALELGIDIGDLDLCILVGYPGSMIATWQRSGRVGRQGQEAALVMIATENALDKYFLSHPGAFRDGKAEHAVLNPFNTVALNAHLECAAAELPLSLEEPWLALAPVGAAAMALEQNGQLKRSGDGQWLMARRHRPHRDVNLRGTGERYRIVDSATGATIGEMDTHRLYRDTHPGAVYMQQSRTYLVHEVNAKQHIVSVAAAHVDYYTRVRSDTDVQILSIDESKALGQTIMVVGRLRVTETIYAYEQVHTRSGRPLNQIPLDAPPSVFETEGVWFPVNDQLCREVARRGFDLMGSLHAAEHAAISLLPLLTLVDRNDLGGLSTPLHPQVRQAAIFIYDGVPGGAGFCLQAYGESERWLDHTWKAVRTCPCESGCPSCVHSPKCGSGNHPIDKSGAQALLKLILRPVATASIELPAIHLPEKQTSQPADVPWQTVRYGVFDLETQRSAQEVGGWHRARLMRISCGVVYDAGTDAYTTYTEEQVEALIDHLKQFDLVVGFNSRRFDYNVLSGYSPFDFNTLPTLDLLEEVHRRLGFRLSLDHLAVETLGEQKSGSGLDALRWWREGRMEEIIDYCREDVRITRDLFRFIRSNGYALYKDKDDRQYRVTLIDQRALPNKRR